MYSKEAKELLPVIVDEIGECFARLHDAAAAEDVDAFGGELSEMVEEVSSRLLILSLVALRDIELMDEAKRRRN